MQKNSLLEKQTLTKKELEQLETLFKKAMKDGQVDISSDDYIGYVINWVHVAYYRYFTIKIEGYDGLDL